MKIKAVIFDVGGVLATEKKERGVHEFVAGKLRITLDEYFDSIDVPYVRSTQGKLSRDKALKMMAENLKVSKRKIESLYAKAYKKNYSQNKELYKFAFNLKKSGYTIAILSDQWPVSKDVLIKEKYMKKFDEVIISCDTDTRKPDRKIYRMMLKKLKLRPPETVFIDNKNYNLVPARKLGMKTILFKDNNQVRLDLKKLGVEI